MALVTLTTAKAHLRIPADDIDSNTDVYSKIAQASAIILEYLKRRANVTATITSSSVANPTVITATNTFTEGDTATIAGHVDSTPDLNGSYVVSNVTSSTFTIPVNVTVAGTGGTATVLWTETTVPGQVQAAVLLMLAHLHEHRGDDPTTDAELWMAIERLLMRSRDPALA